MTDAPVKYPHLFNEVTWTSGPTRAQFVLFNEAPLADKISNVNMVPQVGGDWVLIRLENGSWDILGGTLEPGESYLDTLRRELLEEAGAVLRSFSLFGAWHCVSMAEKPYRPHLPFPECYRIVGLGQVDIVRLPGNPKHAEQVSLVSRMSLDDAASCFIDAGRYDLVELYQLAGRLVNENNCISLC